jgi:lipopolysaccharide assembly protein A
MRWFYLSIIVLFVAATALFAAQNIQPVAVSFLRTSIQTPLALLVLLIYLIGAVSGGSLLAVLRRSFERAQLKRTWS